MNFPKGMLVKLSKTDKGSNQSYFLNRVGRLSPMLQVKINVPFGDGGKSSPSGEKRFAKSPGDKPLQFYDQAVAHKSNSLNETGEPCSL